MKVIQIVCVVYGLRSLLSSYSLPYGYACREKSNDSKRNSITSRSDCFGFCPINFLINSITHSIPNRSVASDIPDDFLVQVGFGGGRAYIYIWICVCPINRHLSWWGVHATKYITQKTWAHPWTRDPVVLALELESTRNDCSFMVLDVLDL